VKLAIKVGDARIEIEGEQLKVVKATSTGTSVEIEEVKTKEEALQETLDKLATAFRAHFSNLTPNS
jgi:hypothetical protein